VAPTYSASATEGLVYAFDYAEGAYRTEVRIREGKPATDTLANYWLLSQTAYRTSSGETHLPASVRRVRSEGQTTLPSADQVEEVLYDYGFFSGTNKALAWA